MTRWRTNKSETLSKRCVQSLEDKNTDVLFPILISSTTERFCLSDLPSAVLSSLTRSFSTKGTSLKSTSSLPGPWESHTSHPSNTSNMAQIQEIRTQLLQNFKQLAHLKQQNKFMYSCMSEGLLPKGLQISFNLANFVNDQNLVREIQGVIDDSNSRLLDLIFEKSQE